MKDKILSVDSPDKGQRGVAAVEFALILPLLIVLVFGIIEFSILLYNKAMLTNASREGARAGIVQATTRLTDAEIEAVVMNYCQNYLITFGSDTLGPEDIDISPAEPRDGLPFGTDLTVTVRYRYDFLLLPNFVTSLFNPLNLSATTVMRME